MAYGVTPQGFVAKRLEDIKKEIEDTFRNTVGSGVNLDARTPYGQIIGIQAEREALLWELAEMVYNSRFPKSASGVGVDNSLSLVGLTRKDPTRSTVILKYFGTPGTAIPFNHTVRKFDDLSVIFQTKSAGVIAPGTGVDEQQKIVFSAVPDAGDWQIEFSGQVTAVLAKNISAAQLEIELENLSNLENVTVVGNFTTGFTITFGGADGQKNQPQMLILNNTLTNAGNTVTATVTTLVEGVLPSVELEAEATVTGPVAAPAGSLTNPGSVIAGIASVTNELDAELGSDLETDAQAKLRRDQSLAFPGNSTIPSIRAELLQLTGVVAVRGFENKTLIPDLSGRPAKSYEIIVQGGDDDEITDVMWRTKPAGIFQYGSVVKNIVDSQGFPQEVRFSRPSEIPIYLIVDLVKDSTFPLDGVAQVKAALVAYGEKLNIGQDVIVVPKLVSVIDSVPGILDITIRIGVAPIPATGSSTVTFANVAGALTVSLLGHGLSSGDRVSFTNAGGALPTGLTANTTYWVVGATTNTFVVAAERGGTPITFLDGGAGVTSLHFGGLEDNISIDETERADFDTSRITVNV